MKKIKKLLFVGMFPILALTMGSCTDYQDEVDALDRRVTTLEELVSRTNKSIEGISTLLGVAENGWIITGMVDVPAKDDPAGLGYYTITLGKLDPATGKFSEKPEDKKTITIPLPQKTKGDLSAFGLDNVWMMAHEGYGGGAGVYITDGTNIVFTQGADGTWSTTQSFGAGHPDDLADYPELFYNYCVNYADVSATAPICFVKK
jgi:hypothetical protein